MSRLALLASAAALACFALAGCAANGTLNPSADTAIQNALAVGCPIVATVQASSLPLTSYEKSAVSTLALVCPPNPPPI
jgi:ABC-type amino acid transport substrate-binding protein